MCGTTIRGVCPVGAECKRWVGFSSPHIHPVITFTKADEYVESKHVDDFEKRVDLQIMLQEFVGLLEGNERYVARGFCWIG